MSQCPTEKSSSSRATTAVVSRPRKQWLILGGVSACISIVLVAAAWALLAGQKETPASVQIPPVESKPQPPKLAVVAEKKSPPKTKKPARTAATAKVAANTEPLWESPTSGHPLNLGYLSPGAQIIAVLRPAALLAHPEAEKIRAALGPAGHRGIESIEKATIARLASMDQLIIGGQVTSAGKWLLTYVVHTRKAISREALVAKLAGATEKTENGQTYWLANERAYYLPSAGSGKVLV